jgi:photosystem II stability/assembly factor-like uncharacterized protein
VRGARRAAPGDPNEKSKIMNARHAVVTLFVATVAVPLAGPVAGAGFADVLDTPAQVSSLASRGLMQAVARAGDRLVAVGQRGHAVVSTDGGKTWKQSMIPVSSDLTAVYFVDGKEGWAVGHDGVVLHTADGGESWQLQLDGRKANDMLAGAMERKVAAEPASESAKTLLAEAKRYKEQGADKPFLDVWFADAQHGYVVGAYNLIFRTANGGKTWEPWFDRTDNPKFFNLYSIRPVAGDVYIAGEGGLMLKLDTAAQRFRALEVPYKGSFFGVAAAGNSVLAFGLRGNVWRSGNGGIAWTKVEAGLPAAIVGAASTAGGEILLADAGGRIAASSDGGRSFAPIAVKPLMPLTGFAELGDGRFVLAGPRGVAVSETAAR